MDGIEKITARIQADGQAELDRLKEDVRQQLQTIHTQTQDQVDRERQDILSRVEGCRRAPGAAEIRRRDGKAQAGAGRQAGGALRGL